MDFSEIINIILGGGLVGTLAAIGSLRSTVAKARAEASKAEAEAESMRINNADHATRVLMENILKPLKDEFNETKGELAETKRELARAIREMSRLRKAINAAMACPHADGCPVLRKLQDPKGRAARDADTDTDGAQGQLLVADKDNDVGDGACPDGDAADSGGQPP